MKFLNLLFFFLLFSNVSVAGIKNLCEDDSLFVAGIEYKISDIIANAARFYEDKNPSLYRFFKNFNKKVVVNIFLLAWSGYIKSFDKEKPYLMRNDSMFIYKNAIKGLFLLRKDLFPALDDCSFLHEIVYHADRDLLIFFMNRVIQNKNVYINLAYSSIYRSVAETLLDLARLMKSVTREKGGRDKYKKIATYLKNKGGLGACELVVCLNKLKGKQKRLSKKEIVLKEDKEIVVRCLLSFRIRDLLSQIGVSFVSA